MLKIREIMTARPGQASKLAKLMKEAMKDFPGTVLVMTDMVGDYNTVVTEYDVESMAAFEKMMADMSANEKPEDKEKWAGYTEMYMTGRREVYRIWD